jgi:hypothetical protein
MGDIVDGRFQEDTVDAILDVMIADLEAEWDEDLPPGKSSAVRELYRPIATRLAQTQRDIGLILDASQVEYATGTALDLLVALIGVTRDGAIRAEGTATFSRSDPATVDYPVPQGTVVQTVSNTPLRYVTTEQVTLTEGTTSVDAKIEAEYPGAKWNVGAGMIDALDSSVSGIESVDNAEAIIGGVDPETDDELRERAQEELANGAKATGPALVSGVRSVEGVTNVTVLINDTPDENGRGYGLPANSFELIVTSDGQQDTREAAAQAVMDTKAVGDPSISGVNGQALDDSLSYVVEGEIETELPNGQTHPVGFSESVKVEIFVDASFTYDPEEYPGDEAAQDSIVDYIGGYTNSGFEQDGQLFTNDDVLYGEVEYALRSVPGVYDVSSLEIGLSDDPTGTSNIDIGAFEQAITDARDGAPNLTLTSTEK